MVTGIRQRLTGALVHLLAPLVLIGAPTAALAQAGTIGGRITDQTTGTGLEASRIVMTGTSRIETSNRNGEYRFRDVVPGTYQVRVLRVGYRPLVRSATVGAGEDATLDFALEPAPVQLDEVVSTATGEQRKLEIANAISTIDVDAVARLSPITEFTNLISGRAPGVQVLKSAGTTGTGTRIRIRGANSVSLSNEPLYYIDGIRSESSAISSTLDIGGFGVGDPANQSPSRINDLNPDDIDNIEIVKGPAAATLYGIQASNGVVRITTKHGNPGRARWNLFSEVGGVSDNNTYPLNYNGRDDTNPDFDGFCILQFELDGLCTQTSVSVYSPLENKDTRPLKTGFRQQHGVNVSGGGDVGTYYLSAGYESEDGVFRLPKFEEDSIRSLLGSVPETQIRPNALEKLSLRANLTGNVSKNANVSAELGYVSSNTRFVQNDNSFLTITGSAEASGQVPEIDRGWFFIPAQLFAEQAKQGAERFTGALTGNWRPAGWLTTRATFGYDIVNRDDTDFFPTGQVADFTDNLAGVMIDNRFQISQTTVDLGGTARFQLSPAVGSRTSVGGQFFRDLLSGTFASGRGLAAGSSTIAGAANTDASETTVESRSAGAYVEEEIALKDRLFVTGALRFDDNSAFGKDFNATTYPKASVSWLMSDEPFWSPQSFINTLRFRGALGVSGQQPGSTDALRFFTSTAGRKEGAATTGVTIGNLGNPNLKPERSREFEVGADAGFFKDRVTVELTYYNKRTKDALILRPIAGSAGSTGSQFFNLGRVKNSGWEVAIDTRIIDAPSFAWDLTVSGSTTKNKVLELGTDVEQIDVGFYQQHRAGYPLGGFWSRTLTGFDDANGDGIIDATEFTVSDTVEFRGNALPTKELSVNTAFTFLNGHVRLGGQVDYRGGHLVDNSIENFRCTPVLNCRGLVDRTTPLDEQARAAAVFNVGANEFAFLEPGWFIKLREVSLTFFMPDRWAHAFRADQLSLTLAGRNLGTITDYSGVDPEVNAFGQDNFSSSDFESQPQVTYWTARLNIGF
jgi:TonB-dependent starch-binding outer membrane protein SusC